MMLLALLGILFLGGLLALCSEKISAFAPRWLALSTLVAEAVLLCVEFIMDKPINDNWLADLKWAWLPRFGINFHLALDGLSLLLIALTLLLGFMAVISSWTEITKRQGFYYFNLLICLLGIVGVFLAVDLFLFFMMWEVMILPMYFMISIWGHENRINAANKFFIFTQLSGLLMLLAMITLVLAYHQQTASYSFDYFDLRNVQLNSGVGFWLMLGFFMAFAVKLPVVPLHSWLPDAHTQAPTGGSVILAGVMLKTGAYGLIRFVLPLFQDAAYQFALIAMCMGVFTVLYGAMLAFAQSDVKRLIAYTSVSHMGFVLLGVFSWNMLAMQGAVITMLAHGISAAALFMIAGTLQERLHTREMAGMGGLWPAMPKLSAMALLFVCASIGLPSFGNFMGEILVLLGAFKTNMPLTVLTCLVLVLAPAYALRFMQKTFYGVLPQRLPIADVGIRHTIALGLLVLATFWLGLHPQPILDLTTPVLQHILQQQPELGYSHGP